MFFKMAAHCAMNVLYFSIVLYVTVLNFSLQPLCLKPCENSLEIIPYDMMHLLRISFVYC